MQLNIKASKIFKKNYQATSRVVLNIGSSRSSKTYSILQMLIVKALEETKKEIYTVARKTLPALKASAYRDFLEIIKTNEVYNENMHNKSDLTYQVGNVLFEFISVDQFDKVKGRKRKHLYINEANEMNYQDFTQLALRTTGGIYMDLNPSHATDHWIETKIKNRDDCEVVHSTYKDNPFLDNQTIFEIERLEKTDPNLWRIYGLGELGISEARIWTHFGLCDELPDNYSRRVYSVDFGYNHPTAVSEVREKDDIYFARELVYESGLTNQDLIKRLNEIGVDKRDVLYCDSAEPQRIEELRRAGFNAQPANKDVNKGIDTVKSKEVNITKDSINIQKESRSYSWQTKPDGTITDKPVKEKDHSMDSIRYAIHSMQQTRFVGFA